VKTTGARRGSVQDEPSAAGSYLAEEPPSGSVVAIDWGGQHQEVWVASMSDIGNWYTTDIRLRGDARPGWGDVLRRSEGRTLTLLVAADPDTYRAGYYAGSDAVAAAVSKAIDGLPGPPPVN
jgi:hypothetical protein